MINEPPYFHSIAVFPSPTFPVNKQAINHSMAASDTGKKRATDDDSSLPASERQKSSPASSSGGNSQWPYQVFLSFRGEDTRNIFTDHLYTRLKQKGIDTFRDDERLERGKEISSELLEAIERSLVSIIILSKNYATSKWCLDELAKIVECMEAKHQIVLPVFYKIDPSDVRNQEGDFKTAFDKYEQDFRDNPEKVERWRSALTRVGKISGWPFHDGSEAELINVIVDKVWERLNQIPSFPSVDEELVGMDSRVEKIYELLRPDISDEIRFVGICGMGGIGKTTIARVLYQKLSDKYVGSCFLANVREVSEKKGLESLQKRLLREVLKVKDLNTCDYHSLIRRWLPTKKIFLVLDDVDQLEQLERLARSKKWFGSGSRIIVTTRDERVLASHGINNIYKVTGLDYDEAQRLFCLKAFKRKRPTDNHIKLLWRPLCYVNGLPLAIKVLGSFLCDRSVSDWISELDGLRAYPWNSELDTDETIMTILGISYDRLDRTEKEIFLYIACFLKGKDVVEVKKSLNRCALPADAEISDLEARSLITIENNKVQMHDLVQRMGWETLQGQHPDECSKWNRRTWQHENMVTPTIEAMIPVEHKKDIPHVNASDTGKKRATDDDSSLPASERQKSSPASSSGGNSRWTYEVFLSFRGEDTRNNFADHLYTALKQKGIDTFRDDETLERGKEISPELEVIERSIIFIIIISKNYASSKWCLDELAKIVECAEAKHQTVLPVFYKVDSSHVRNQEGDFKTAFDKHEQNFRDHLEKVKRWRSALTQVGNISGWHLHDGSEAELINDIVDNVRKILDQIPSFPSVDRELVGIDSRLEEIYELLRPDISDEVRFVGIWGMGGIGKTTIARVLYRKLSDKYEGSCFLANVREVSERKGLESLQKILLREVLKVKDLNTCDYDSLITERLRRKKIFLVLDDVDQLEQLNKLAEREWFGSGSRIIITTRNVHVLRSYGINYIYKVRELDNDEANRLFYLKAYKQRRPTTADDEELSKRVVCYADRLPLALEILGSFLCGRNVNEWERALKNLQAVPSHRIVEKLRISYDELESVEKKIFLDIACFFKGKDVYKVKEILDSCNFYPDIGIRILVERYLITIEDNKLQMHDVVQEMGWEVVREKHPCEPGKWSRLWPCEDVYRVLATYMITPTVEAIIIPNKLERDTIHVNGEWFSIMSNLRLLNISNVHIYEDLKYLSDELRILKWGRYPLKTLPSSFHPQKLLQLSLCYSCIEYLWNGTKCFRELRTIKLSHSQNLIKTPDFTMISNLERLDLQYCTRLHEVHQSVGSLKRLVILNLNKCENLVKFPSDVSGLESLEILNLHGCTNLKILPLNLGAMKRLEELDIRGTAIREVPSTIVQLKSLKTLSVQGQHLPTWPEGRLIISLPPIGINDSRVGVRNSLVEEGHTGSEDSDVSSGSEHSDAGSGSEDSDAGSGSEHYDASLGNEHSEVCSGSEHSYAS